MQLATEAFRRREVENRAFITYGAVMSVAEEPVVVAPEIESDQESRPRDTLDPGYLVICWNDPVNLMVYVTHVFQVVFGWQRQKAEHHMLEVHNKGRSLLARETLERAEFHVHQLQEYGLHATMERDKS